MSDYLMKKKSLIDNLAFAGYSMSNDDKLMCILSGLGSDYNPFIISVTSVPHSYSIAEITSLLLTHEARMDQTSHFETLSANIAASKKGNGQVNFVNKSSHQQSGQFPKPANQSQGGYNNYNGGRKGRGRGRNSYTNNRPPCQICHRTGHGAYRCYYRFDQTFQQPQYNNNGASNPAGSASNQGSMQAMIATPNTVADSSWFPDSGATNHCTPDVNNLQQGAPYQGTERIYMGNGSCYEEGSSSRNS
ncbi:hypothetical protein ACOSQ2_029112 [Xanthoceras sorbifolium]